MGFFLSLDDLMLSRRRLGVDWGKFMKENWSRHPPASGEAAGDKTIVSLSYDRLLVCWGLCWGTKKNKGLGFA